MVSDTIKLRLSPTPIAPLLLRVRQIFELGSTALFKLESISVRAENHITESLLARISQVCFVDVGAHVGAVMGMVQRSGVPIIAIEAVPSKAEALKRLYPKAIVHSCAAGSVEQDVTFYIDTKRTAYSSLTARDGQEITVPMKRLDDLITSEIDVIKIDVERAELEVLKGAERVIGQNLPLVVFESVRGKEGLFEWFSARDYQIFVPSRVAHDAPALSESGFEDAHYYPRRTTNYFAIHESRRIEFRDQARAILRI